jgi:hypothetical protein
VAVALVTLGSLPVQAASVATAPAPGLDLSQRTALGLALVGLGLLVLALTIVRLRIQDRRRRSPSLAGSPWLKVTDTWGVYSTMTARRSTSRSTW